MYKQNQGDEQKKYNIYILYFKLFIVVIFTIPTY